MAEIELIQLVELDLKPCSLTYGEYPCGAILNTTGDRKCFNSPATCQVPEDFVEGDVETHRFAIASERLPIDLDFIPNINDINLRPQEVQPGQKLGTRESVTISFSNHRHNDVGFDNYISDRGYNTYERGTFWGKFTARWPNIQGAEIRTLIGDLDADIDDLETRHYYVESTTGPDASGTFKIVAKDALKFLDGKKAQAPKPSGGALSAALTDVATSLTLTPAGIGNLEYPASGTASIGGEMVTFTRSGDDITLTGRGQYSSEQEEHDEDETFQLAEVFTAEDPADILDELIFGTNQDGTTRTKTPTAYRNLTAWQTETANYFGRLYSAVIARPTPISALVSEIIEHVGLLFYPDIISETIRLRVLRQGVVSLAVSDDIVKPGSFAFKQEENLRISAVWTSYGQKNPLLNLDEDGNYKAIAALYDSDEVKLLEGLPDAIKRTRSRWIIVENRVAANDFNERMIERFGDTPGSAKFALPYGYPVKVGSNITLQSRIFEDDTGAQADAQGAIVTSVERTPGWYECLAETIQFRLQSGATPSDSTRIILIDEDALNINLRSLHDLIYVEPTMGDNVSVIIGAGVIIGAAPKSQNSLGFVGNAPERYPESQFATCDPAFDVGDWPAGVTIEIVNNGRIFGGGGRGGWVTWGRRFPTPDDNWAALGVILPSDGGVALYTRYAITLDNQGEIWGAGGGGGANNPDFAQGTIFYSISFGGNGAGHIPATVISDAGGIGSPIELRRKNTAGDNPGGGGYAKQLATSTDPNYYTDPANIENTATGAGGAAGVDGTDGDPDTTYTYSQYDDGAVAGGSAGAGVDGDSYVTYTTAGDIKGSQIN